MEMDDSRSEMYCTFCGGKIANVAQKIEVTQNINQNITQNVTVTHKVDRSGEPNLVINYASSNMGVMMVTRIVATGQKNTYQNGQTMTFRLAPGRHVIVLKIGNRNYNREVFIGEQQVRINASFNGRAYINIDQPQENTANIVQATADNSYGNSSTVAPRAKQSGLGIAGFVCSLTVYFSIIGLVLGILDIVLLSKNDDGKSHGLAKAAIIIGSIFSVILFISLVASCSSN